MRILTYLVCALMALGSLSLAGCGRGEATTGTAPSVASRLTVFADVSTSNDEQANPAVATRAAHLAAEEFGRFRLGDTAQVYVVGDRSHALSPPLIATGYRNRMPAAMKALEAQLVDVFARSRQQGDGSTNILFTLQAARPVCGSASEVVLLSDGIEESEAYSVSRALAAGRAVTLPPPPGRFLQGCRAQVIGLGVSAASGGSGTQMLPTAAMNALMKGWTDYFVAAGVRPGDLNFRTIL